MVYIFPQPGWEHLWTRSVVGTLDIRGGTAFNTPFPWPPTPVTPVISTVLMVMGSGAIFTYFWSVVLASPLFRDTSVAVVVVAVGT